MIMPIAILLQQLTGEATGIYYIDSTKLQICHNKRTGSNRVFGKLAKIGKSSYGWFMGYKLHLLINHKGDIMAVKITKGNKSDVSYVSNLVKGLSGNTYGDKGYISKNLANELRAKGMRLITGIRKDMKNHLLEMSDKILLRKRSLIESAFNVLKNRMELEHTRHRSPINFLVHIIACVAAYAISKTPNISLASSRIVAPLS